MGGLVLACIPTGCGGCLPADQNGYVYHSGSSVAVRCVRYRFSRPVCRQINLFLQIPGCVPRRAWLRPPTHNPDVYCRVLGGMGGDARGRSRTLLVRCSVHCVGVIKQHYVRGTGASAPGGGCSLSRSAVPDRGSAHRSSPLLFPFPRPRTAARAQAVRDRRFVGPAASPCRRHAARSMCRFSGGRKWTSPGSLPRSRLFSLGSIWYFCRRSATHHPSRRASCCSSSTPSFRSRSGSLFSSATDTAPPHQRRPLGESAPVPPSSLYTSFFPRHRHA